MKAVLLLFWVFAYGDYVSTVQNAVEMESIEECNQREVREFYTNDSVIASGYTCMSVEDFQLYKERAVSDFRRDLTRQEWEGPVQLP